jgi:Aerotolerance regulator N-terminal
MTFVFPLLLGGLVLTGIPVLLHLIVRRKPKRLPFPAFRFLVQQQRSNLRKLRLRHLLLLLLRVALIAGMCLLLARPRLFHRALGLDSERPVQAALLFDTSASMEYRSTDGMTRLDEAKEHARKLLDQLAAGSQVAIVDTADARFDQPLDWLPMIEARKRIANLKVRYANAPVTQALGKTLSQLDAATEPTARTGPARMRLVAVLSDRTGGSWDGAALPGLVEKVDRLAPAYEGLAEARGQVGSLMDLLRELRTQIPPPAGKDYAEQSLLEALSAMQLELAGLTPERERWPQDLAASVRQVRRLGRDLLVQLAPPDPASSDPAQAYRGKLRAVLSAMLRATSGAQMLYIDAGIEAPVDLVLAAVELPRTAQGIAQQLFADGEPFTLQAVVQASGKDAAVTVACEIGDVRQETQVAVKAGERQTVPFRVGEGKLLLKPGDNSIAIHLDARPEAMPHAHHRFVTVRVRARQKVIVLVDDPERQGSFAKALTALGYAPEVRPVKGLAKDALTGAAAVYLLGVAAPEAHLWTTLADYVKTGGSLGIVPAGGDLSRDAYNQKAAQPLMPANIDDKIDSPSPGGSEWNWATAKYGHSFMKPFKAWKDHEHTDFMRFPRGAYAYWGVTPRDALVLVAYHDGLKKPAVLERRFDAAAGIKGKTLLFTTPLDEQDPRWNNYAENVTSFYLALVSQATGYLAGETAAPQLNFTLGQGDPLVALPAGPALSPITKLIGPEQRLVTLDPGQTQLVVKDLTQPGNYLFESKARDSGELRRLAGFSLNVPAEECDLTKVPGEALEPLFGGDVLAMPPDDILQSYRNEPLDLMPYFMLALLLALALENLLANKFYRQADA